MFFETEKLYLKAIPLFLVNKSINQNNYFLDLFLNMHVFYIFQKDVKN